MSSADQADHFWVRVGGGLEELPSGRRHGPADPDFPPPGGPWAELRLGGQLVGWAPPGLNGRALARQAEDQGRRLERERRVYLLRRLGHKLRSSVLALQESARQAAFGHQELMEIWEQAQDVERRAQALEVVALDPLDAPRSVVLGAVLSVAAPGAHCTLPGDAVVRVPEPVLTEALHRASEWMGGAGATFGGERVGTWWRLDLHPAAGRRPLAVPELGEPLVRLLVDSHLEGWLDASGPDSASIYLPAV